MMMLATLLILMITKKLSVIELNGIEWKTSSIYEAANICVPQHGITTLWLVIGESPVSQFADDLAVVMPT